MVADSWDDRGAGHPPKPPRSFPPDRRPKWHVEPITPSDLLQRAGTYAEATRIHVEWGAISTWLMKAQADQQLEANGISPAVANLSVFLSRQAEEREAGWPCLSGIIVTPAIYGYSQDSQCEARRTAAEVHALWEAAGRPHLDADACKMAHRYLVACVRKGTIRQVLTIGEVPPLAS